jgi:hypothetical protein
MKEEEKSPKDVLVLPAVIIGAGGLAFVALEVLLRTVWTEVPWWDVRAISAAVGLIPGWMLTKACFGQKHTYNPEIYRKNPGCLIPAWLFFWSMMTLLMGIVLGAPAAAFTYGLILAVHQKHWIFAPGMLAAGLFALPISVSALSRGLLLWASGRHIEEMATSTARAATAGLVELRGVARPVEGSGGFLFGQTPEDSAPAVPFLLEDATGRIRVEPPAVDPNDDPRFALKLHPLYGLRSLEAGDPILVIGAVKEDPARPGERIVTPWTSRGLPFGTGLLSRPEIFLLIGGDETWAKKRLARTRLGWLALGAALTAGSLVMAGVAALALVRPAWLAGLALGVR